MTLLSQRKTEEKAKVTISGQYEIIQSIQHFKQEGFPIEFVAINDYILAFQGQFQQQFKVELTNVVLNSYRNNGHALASLAHLLMSCSEAPFLSEIEGLRDKLKLIVQENMD